MHARIGDSPWAQISIAMETDMLFYMSLQTYSINGFFELYDQGDAGEILHLIIFHSC